jgi:hypothetical protein
MGGAATPTEQIVGQIGKKRDGPLGAGFLLERRNTTGFSLWHEPRDHRSRMRSREHMYYCFWHWSMRDIFDSHF